jgi:hypothetical protein
MNDHYFMIHANPQQSSKHAKYGGAYISCWINFPLIDSAEQTSEVLYSGRWMEDSQHPGKIQSISKELPKEAKLLQ